MKNCFKQDMLYSFENSYIYLQPIDLLAIINKPIFLYNDTQEIVSLIELI